MTDWKIKPNGKKADFWGGGGFKDDLEKVAYTLGANKEQLLDTIQNIIQDIKVKKIIIKSGEMVDCIKFFYHVEANDRKYEVEG
ncbi:MAG: hypothetical protein MRERC_6c035 [Mycoplasmataceae bacterium RC_NB112A]|nr:MAG: hypothetical protein MRERC_13c036 [Mycoplasmataceae bacterium RC_NB112A]KLL01948.1 MAG: hypothetical protein MRERC_6c035 [Mycoplasmataceae bacterium RC_NB112A]